MFALVFFSISFCSVPVPLHSFTSPAWPLKAFECLIPGVQGKGRGILLVHIKKFLQEGFSLLCRVLQHDRQPLDSKAIPSGCREGVSYPQGLAYCSSFKEQMSKQVELL